MRLLVTHRRPWAWCTAMATSVMVLRAWAAWSTMGTTEPCLVEMGWAMEALAPEARKGSKKDRRFIRGVDFYIGSHVRLQPVRQFQGLRV